jgi:hypothetical protein
VAGLIDNILEKLNSPGYFGGRLPTYDSSGEPPFSGYGLTEPNTQKPLVDTDQLTSTLGELLKGATSPQQMPEPPEWQKSAMDVFGQTPLSPLAMGAKLPALGMVKWRGKMIPDTVVESAEALKTALQRYKNPISAFASEDPAIMQAARTIPNLQKADKQEKLGSSWLRKLIGEDNIATDIPTVTKPGAPFIVRVPDNHAATEYFQLASGAEAKAPDFTAAAFYNPQGQTMVLNPNVPGVAPHEALHFWRDIFPYMGKQEYFNRFGLDKKLAALSEHTPQEITGAYKSLGLTPELMGEEYLAHVAEGGGLKLPPQFQNVPQFNELLDRAGKFTEDYPSILQPANQNSVLDLMHSGQAENVWNLLQGYLKNYGKEPDKIFHSLIK